MYPKNILILLFVLLFNTLTYEQEIPGAYEVRELSLNRPYPFVFSTMNSHWQLTGNTLATDKFIRLTSDSQSRVGGLWSTVPVPYPDWEIQVQFKVHGENKNIFADGFAIWYVKTPLTIGPVFGYQDYFSGLGIILDTYANKYSHTHSFPYISAIVNNGTLHYDIDSDGENITLAGCEAAFRARDTDTSIAIRYENDRLTVSTDIYGANTWTECFSRDNIHLPTHYYFGFTAHTGDLTDNHDIISVRTFQLESSEQRKNQDRSLISPSAPVTVQTETVSHGEKSFNWSALKIFLVVIVVIFIMIGLGVFFYYQQNRRRGPRFY